MAFRKLNIQMTKTEVVDFSDNLLFIGKDSGLDKDVGFLGRTGSTRYSGVIRDSDTGEFLLIDQITLTSNTVNDVSALDASLQLGDLRADAIFATSFTGEFNGDVTGNVSGNVIGNLTGDVVGDVTGDVTGNLTGNVEGDVTISSNFVLPRMTTAQRDAIGSPTRGQMIYNTDTNMFSGWNGNAWVQLVPSTYVETP